MALVAGSAASRSTPIVRERSAGAAALVAAHEQGRATLRAAEHRLNLGLALRIWRMLPR